jgi:hypothetical protein
MPSELAPLMKRDVGGIGTEKVPAQKLAPLDSGDYWVIANL